MHIYIKCLAASVVGLTCGPISLAQDCPSNLVGYWPLDGTPIEFVSNSNGTENGNVNYVAGRVGEALELDGNGSYISAGFDSTRALSGKEEATLAAWIQITEPVDGAIGNGDGATIAARTFCNAGNYQLYGNLGGSLYFSKWDSSASETQFHTPIFTPSGEWRHITARLRQDQVDFFVNGELSHSQSTPTPSAINSMGQDVHIGWDSCSSYWYGLIDEVVVFDAAVSDDMILTLYNNGVAGLSVCGAGAEDQLKALIAKVRGLEIRKPLKRNLNWKLRTALWKLRDRRAQNDHLAVRRVNRFKDLVAARSGTKIDSEVANELINDANAILSSLER